MIKRLWEKLTGIDRLKHEIKRLRENRDATFESMVRANDRAYDRRVALKAIADCETPGANATVKRMAKIARAALETTHFADKVRDAAVTVEGQPGDVFMIGPFFGGAGGPGLSGWQPGEPGEVKIGRGVTAKGGAGGGAK